MDNNITWYYNKIHTTRYNCLDIVIGTLFTADLLYVTFLTYLILNYKILHNRINWLLFNWFITVIICLLFNAIQFFTTNMVYFNVFLYYYCHVTTDVIISNVYFILMLSFETIITNINHTSFKFIIILVWLIAILQYCLNCYVNIRYIQISLCQVPIIIIIIKYLLLICELNGKCVNYNRRLRLVTIGNYLLVYLGGFIIHTIYYNELPNVYNYFQLFYYNVFVICPIYISIYQLTIDKNFRKCFLHSIKCRSYKTIQLTEIAILENISY